MANRRTCDRVSNTSTSSSSVENTEDLYAGLEHEVVPGVVESLKIITERASTRIAHFAFDYACAWDGSASPRPQSQHHEDERRVVHPMHASGRGRASEYRYDEQIVDAACMNLVMKPEKFDVLVLPTCTATSFRICVQGRRRARHRGDREPRRDGRRLRSGACGARGHRRQEHRKPDGAVAVCAADDSTTSANPPPPDASKPRRARARDSRKDDPRSAGESVNTEFAHAIVQALMVLPSLPKRPLTRGRRALFRVRTAAQMA